MGTSRVSLFLIDDNPLSIRIGHNPTKVTDLAEDIRRQGLVDIPLGRQIPAGWVQLAFGCRRRLAFHYLADCYGDKTWWAMPLEIKLLSDEEMALWAWRDNVSRADLTVIEKARALQRDKRLFGYSLTSLAQLRDLSLGEVNYLLHFLHLPEAVQILILQGKLQEGHARVLLPLIRVAKNPGVAVHLAQCAVERNQPVAQSEKKVSAEIERLTMQAGTVIMAYQDWKNGLLPDGCQVTCHHCPHFSYWEDIPRCARPNQYYQKYLAWQTLQQPKLISGDAL